MTLNDAFEGPSIQSTQFVQRGSLILLAVTASLLVMFRSHNGIVLGALLLLGTLVVPTGFVLMRRIKDKSRQRATEDLLLMQTRTFLQNQKPARKFVPAVGAEETDIEILARAIDGQRLPIQGFRKYGGIAFPAPLGEPVVFDALPRRYAIRGLCNRRFVHLAAMMPKPAPIPDRN
ncbi:MAG: hypothetical protein ABSF54_25375 [Bryobacteraceae bacterium]|jgi:hypothetical protein